MARKLTAESAITETAKHNSKSRLDSIMQAQEETYQLDAAIEEIMAEKIADHRARKREIKSRLAEDFQITAEVFNAGYRMYRLNRRAHDSADSVTQDALHEMWQTVEPGGQASFLDVIDPNAEEPSLADTIGVEEAKAYERGYDRAMTGNSPEAIAYKGKKQAKLRARYDEGFGDGRAEFDRADASLEPEGDPSPIEAAGEEVPEGVTVQ